MYQHYKKYMALHADTALNYAFNLYKMYELMLCININ